MAALLKNQILKILSRFAKNVDASQLKFSSLSQANLSDLVLNEEVLSNVLELPIWIKLSRAVCNRVSIQIPWTHLSSLPIRICLDEMYVEMETCSDLRSPTGSPTFASGESYGRTEAIIDGMFLTVNSVEIHFRAPSFHSSIQVNRIKVFSANPNYELSSDLRMSRLKDESKDAVLVFKCVTWQTLRIEATSGARNSGADVGAHSSIRLITSSGQARIALKKAVSSCELLAARLQIIMDDLLWVLTPTQLKAAWSVVEELQMLASKADEVVRKTVAEKKLNETRRVKGKKGSSSSSSAKLARYFESIDISETSYHIHLAKLNLHICDEPRLVNDSTKVQPEIKVPKFEDAAILIELHALKIDCYPYHLSEMVRNHWLVYTEPDRHYMAWQKDAVMDHLTRTGTKTEVPPDIALRYLMSSVFVFRINDFRVNNMTTIKQQKAKDALVNQHYPFCCSTKKDLHLPETSAAVHLEYIVHYYPPSAPFTAAPPHLLHIFCNPVQMTLHPATIDWLTQVASDVFSGAAVSTSSFNLDELVIPPILCRYEALMPKIVCPVEFSQRMLGLQIQSGKGVATNASVGRTRSLTDSLNTLETIEESRLHCTDTFPSRSSDVAMTETLLFVAKQAQEENKLLSLWSLSSDCTWLDFIDLRQPRGRPMPFIEATPGCLWLTAVPPSGPAFVLVDVMVPCVRAQINNEGYNILLRCVDVLYALSEAVTANCTSSAATFTIKQNGVKDNKREPAALLAVAVLPKAEITLLLDRAEGRPTSSRDSEAIDNLSVNSARINSFENILEPPSNMSSNQTNDDFDSMLQSEGLEVPFSEAETLSVQSDFELADLTASRFVIPSPNVVTSLAPSLAPSLDGASLRPEMAEFGVMEGCATLTLTVENVNVIVTSTMNAEVCVKVWCGGLGLREGATEKEWAVQEGKENASEALLRLTADVVSLAQVVLQKCTLRLSNEVAGKLAGFFQTDLTGESMPLSLTVRQCEMYLHDGLPAKVTSGVVLPLLSCRRGKDGVMMIEPTNEASKNETKEERLQRLQEERRRIDEELNELTNAQK
ncbi:hypothetical protein RvY_14962 [Ramazzottius varieornatus]|uniref:Uncharacterized protein n=1 Tax=Ramazzottius varieornatus TaxID=947166 RepID=A0A1D1VY30_RAMVA|nr:hypothetical protein RvY_14962 [Ramazzottius varieornatus]